MKTVLRKSDHHHQHPQTRSKNAVSSISLTSNTPQSQNHAILRRTRNTVGFLSFVCFLMFSTVGAVSQDVDEIDQSTGVVNFFNETSLGGLPRSFSLRPDYERIDFRSIEEPSWSDVYSVLSVMEFHLAKSGSEVLLSCPFADWACRQIAKRNSKPECFEKVFVDAIKKYGVCCEALMLGGVEPCGAALKDALTRTNVSAKWFPDVADARRENRVPDLLSSLFASIAEGNPVILFLGWPQTPKFNKSSQDVILSCEKNKKPAKQHFVVLLGYEIDSSYPGGGRVLVKSFHDKTQRHNTKQKSGYLWIPFDYIKDNLARAFSVSVPAI